MRNRTVVEPWRTNEERADGSDVALLSELLGASVAFRLLARFGRLRDVAMASPDELRALGLKPRHVKILGAAYKLALRVTTATVERGKKLTATADVAAYFSERLALLDVEEFWALALDVRHRVMCEIKLARGSMTAVEVHPRDVFRELIRLGAAAVIFCHNHPSGTPDPSRQDVEITHRLKETGRLVGIDVLDHVVVAPGGLYVSLTGFESTKATT